MAKTITELTVAGAVDTANDLLWLEQSGLPRKITPAALGVGGGGGGNIDTFNFQFSTSTNAFVDPGSGFVVIDNATPSSANNMAISATDFDSIDLDADMGRVQRSTVITIRDPADPTKFMRFSVDNTTVDNAGWWRFPINHIEGGTIPANNAQVSMQMRDTPDMDSGVVSTGTILTYNATTGRYEAKDGPWRLTDSGGVSTFHSNNHLLISSSLDIRIDSPTFYKERAAAKASVATWGQVWTKDDAPNTLWFTDDGGTDHQLGVGATTIVGITGTMAEYDTSLTDGNFAYAGGAYHDGFSDFVTNEHLDWTADIGGTNLHANNSANGALALTSGEVTQLANIGATVISAADWTAVSVLVGTNTGDNAGVTSVTGGVGVDSTGGTTPSITLDVDELAVGGTLLATDHIIAANAAVSNKQLISAIPLGIFNNDQGWTSSAGTVTGTGANDQLAVWTGTSALEGTSSLTFGGTQAQISSAAPFWKFEETGVTGTPVWWWGADGGAFSLRLNNTGFHALTVNTNAGNDTITNVTFPYNTDFSAGIDVTGTMAATTVTGANVTSGANPGHTHTGSSISALDAGDITTGTLPVLRGGTGVTTKTGTGNVVLSATQTLTGTLTAAIADFSGLVSVGASGITSTSGGLTLAADNTIVSVFKSATDMIFRVFGSGGGLEYVNITHDSTEGRISSATGPLFLSGASDLRLRVAGTEVAILCVADGAVTIRHNNIEELRTVVHNTLDSISGAEVKNFDGDFTPVGLGTMKAVTKSSALNISETHIHKTIRITNVTGSITFLNDTGMAVDSVGWIINTTTSNQTLAATSNNLEVFAGDAVANNTGNMTLAGKGWCTWRKLSDTEYELVGVGLT